MGGALGCLGACFKAHFNKQMNNVREMISDIAVAEDRLFFCKQKTAYEVGVRLVGLGICIRYRP